jgi:hypothetical protein
MEIRKNLGSATQGLTVEELEQLLLANFDRADTSARVDAYQDLQPHISLASNS